MTYAVLKETLFSEEVGTYVTYGIECNDGGSVQKVSDVSCELEKVESLVGALNLWNLPRDIFSPLVRSWVGG